MSEHDMHSCCCLIVFAKQERLQFASDGWTHKYFSCIYFLFYFNQTIHHINGQEYVTYCSFPLCLCNTTNEKITLKTLDGDVYPKERICGVHPISQAFAAKIEEVKRIRDSLSPACIVEISVPASDTMTYRDNNKVVLGPTTDLLEFDEAELQKWLIDNDVAPHDAILFAAFNGRSFLEISDSDLKEEFPTVHFVARKRICSLITEAKHKSTVRPNFIYATTAAATTTTTTVAVVYPVADPCQKVGNGFQKGEI
jgi:hypothetical protein